MASSPQPQKRTTGSLGNPGRSWGLRRPLEESDAGKRFDSVIASSPMGMQFFALEGDQLLLTGANAAADRILDIDHSELIGKTIEEAFPVLAPTEVPNQYRQIAKHGGTWRTQQVRAEAQQIQRAFEVHVFATGPGQLATIFFDITAEAEVASWKQRYELVAAASGEVVHDYDVGQDANVWSGNLETVLGYKSAELTGGIELWAACVHPEDRSMALDALQTAGTNGTPYKIEYRFAHKNGAYRWIHDRGSFLTDAEGNPTHMVGMMRDVTEQKHLEENLVQAQKMEAIGRLAGGVAHDFNNILTAILGFNERILEQVPRDSQLHLHAIEVGKAAQRAAALTQQLLAFGRKQVLQPRLLNLNEVILDYEAMLARVIGKNMEFAVTLAPELPPVKVDRGQVGQILMNLALNARDAMPDGGSLHIATAFSPVDAAFVRAHPDIPPVDYAQLSVTDTGHGLDDEAKARLFEPFFTTKESGKGTGLGLASTYGIVRQNSGYLLVESSPTKGTAFTVLLPAAMGDVETATTPVPPSDQLPRGTETILVAEDEPAVREFVTLVLTELGYNVLSAEDGEEAQRVARQHAGPKIDLLFTDVVMPRVSGKELADALVAQDPDLKVVFASGYTRDVFSRDRNLPDDVTLLQKPFSSAVLAKAVRQALDTPAKAKP